MKADIKVPEDRDETIDSMQPMKIGESSPRLPDVRDLAVDPCCEGSSLPQGVSTALANLVRAMNCYYSNLIERTRRSALSERTSARGARDHRRDRRTSSPACCIGTHRYRRSVI
jgi:hypothetical protein